jgi:hypothetical protein
MEKVWMFNNLDGKKQLKDRANRLLVGKKEIIVGTICLRHLNAA